MIKKLKKTYQKNIPEVIAFISGNAPKFLYGIRYFKDIPVFCYHSVDYESFNNQLSFLKSNNYKTLNGQELLDRLSDKNYKNDGSEIVITFDDGMASVWTVGLPLLEKFEFKIVLFIIPGLMIEGDNGHTLNDDLSSENKLCALNRDFSEHPLCNWSEIESLHESGLVDIQSHGMHHSLVGIDEEIEDFIHPTFDPYHYGNIHIPAFENLTAKAPLSRDFVLGHPVYKSQPRLKGSPRFKDNLQVRQACAAYVADNGGSVFFKSPNWREQLKQLVAKHTMREKIYESQEEVTNAIFFELTQSKKIIEERLPGTRVDHFCFPWFQACEASVSAAYEAGYKVVHLGATPGFKALPNTSYPYIVTRLQEEYLTHLPGKNNISLMQVLNNKRGERS